MRKYDLTKMLEEIRRDEGGAAPAKKVLTQQQIKALASARRKAAKPPAK